ncbi:UNVERIFIED_CONTAM: hypothetical protein Scaly_2575800 [Sesamum calycinum]|uniref:Endonuclease/exonuclease/phosphatase domain-containing protein n=1 Tax=Sesamum calycinum TaxID=2727403 RepID=A0AAW2JHQ8_9LAMI
MEGSMAHADSSQQNKVSRTRGLLTDITNQTVEAAPQPRSPAERNESARLELSRVGESLDRESGGLAILWQKSVDIQLQSFSRYHIDVSVRVKESDEWWRFSGIYGEPDTSKRDHTWRLLRRLHSQSIRPWLCAGDFNEILEHSEKEGGPPRAEWLIRNFRNCLADCELQDLGFHGYSYTWCNQQQYPHTVRERLDRACASLSWSQLFPEARIQHLTTPYSDHSPILIVLRPAPIRNRVVGRKFFRFEAAWLQEPECELMVTETWRLTSSSQSASTLRDKISAVGARLSTWGKLFGRETRERIATLERSILSLNQEVLTGERKERELKLKAELTKLITQEEVFWKQRSKDLWLKAGDRNSSFFHAKANRRHHINLIQRLKKDDGSWGETKEEVQQIIVEYFENMFTSNRPHPDDIQ